MKQLTKDLLTLFQVVVGLAWVAGVIWAVLALGAVAEPISTAAVLIYWGPMLVGPLLMIVGSLCVAGNIRLRMTSVVAFVGSLVLVAQALLWVVPAAHQSWFDGERWFSRLVAGVVAVTALSAISAFVLLRDARPRPTVRVS